MILNSDAAPAGLCHIGEVCCYFHWAEERVPHPERQPDAAAVPNSTALPQPPVVPCRCIRSCDWMRKSKDDLRVSNFRNPPNMAMTCRLSFFQRISCGKFEETVPNSAWITVWGPQQNVTIARGRFTFDCRCNFTLMVSKNDRIQNSVRLLQFIL